MAYERMAIRVPHWMIKELDNLVSRGYFLSRSEAMRFALRLLFSFSRLGDPAEVKDEVIKFLEARKYGGGYGAERGETGRKKIRYEARY